MKTQPHEINDWLIDLRSFVKDRDEAILSLLDLYIEESRFGWHYIEASLAELQPGEKILEVGAGALILSCYVQSRGFSVEALEPLGSGFTHFSKLRDLVLAHAATYQVFLTVNDCLAENLEAKNCYSFAYSINVMEHVSNLQLAIEKITEALKKGATYKFTCPNYIFPYEPHFEIPIIFSKKITFLIFEKSIKNNPNHVDAIGLWNSLNWISVKKLREIMPSMKHVELCFKKDLLIDLFRRIDSDPIFSARRSKFSKIVARLTILLNLKFIILRIPASFFPIIDCELRRR